MLVHYDLKKPFLLACDASPYGVGAVISHFMEKGKEKPIAFASRTLTASEGIYEKVPFVSVWSEVYIAYRSSAAAHDFSSNRDFSENIEI